MKNIILPNKELRLLSGQLQNFNAGFTVQQIRSLDRVVRVMETILQPFTEGINKILSGTEPISETATEKEKAEIEAKKAKELEDYLKTKGEEKVTCPIEDTGFEFIKMVWSKMSSLSGLKEARETIIKIDDAIQGANTPVFDNGETKLEPADKPKIN